VHYYEWTDDGPLQLDLVAPTTVSEHTQMVMATCDLPALEAIALLRRHSGSTEMAVGAFFDGNVPVAALKEETQQLRVHWRAVVSPVEDEVKALVDAHPALEWSHVRSRHVGREGWVMAIDEADNTVQIEHYDKARSWYCRDAVARVIDPVMESQQLRFTVGQNVECNMGDEEGWVPGVVNGVWHRQPGWGGRQTVPYSIEIHDGRGIFAPFDRDSCIRSQAQVSGYESSSSV